MSGRAAFFFAGFAVFFSEYGFFFAMLEFCPFKGPHASRDSNYTTTFPGWSPGEGYAMARTMAAVAAKPMPRVVR